MIHLFFTSPPHTKCSIHLKKFFLLMLATGHLIYDIPNPRFLQFLFLPLLFIPYGSDIKASLFLCTIFFEHSVTEYSANNFSHTNYSCSSYLHQIAGLSSFLLKQAIPINIFSIPYFNVTIPYLKQYTCSQVLRLLPN